MSKLVLGAATGRWLALGPASWCNWPQFHRRARVLGVTRAGLTASSREKRLCET